MMFPVSIRIRSSERAGHARHGERVWYLHKLEPHFPTLQSRRIIQA